MTFLGIWSISVCNGFAGTVWAGSYGFHYIIPHAIYNGDIDLNFYSEQHPVNFTPIK